MLVEDARSVEGVLEVDEYFEVKEAIFLLHLHLDVLGST